MSRRPSIPDRPGKGGWYQPGLFDAPERPVEPERPKEPSRVGPSLTPHQKGLATRRQRESEDIEEAKALSLEGDDTSLLPYQPTPSINPPRPRTLSAGYSPANRTLYVRFRDGTPWEYHDVSPQEWKNFRRVQSPGRYINRVLNGKPYNRGDF